MPTSPHRIAGGILFAVVFGIFGAVLGGFLAAKVLFSSGMGWDRLAQTLGGLMLGGGIALLLGIVAAFRLSPRTLYWGSAAAAGASVLLILLARAL